MHFIIIIFKESRGWQAENQVAGETVSCLQSTPSFPRKLLTSPSTPSRARVQVSRGGPSPNLDICCTPLNGSPTLSCMRDPCPSKRNKTHAALKCQPLTPSSCSRYAPPPQSEGNTWPVPKERGVGPRESALETPAPAP